MGNCLKKKKKTLGRVMICQNCGRNFRENDLISDFISHQDTCQAQVNNFQQIQLQIEQPQQQVQQVQQPPQMIPPPPQPMQEENPPLIQQQQSLPMNYNTTFSQAILEDFHNNGKKHYWYKEYTIDHQYNWVKKPIPPLPEKTVQGILQIPWNKIKLMEFPTKQTWFRLNLERLRVPWQYGADNLHVSKESFLMSTLGAMTGIDWHKEVKIIIEDEKVLDAGGLLREWISLTMKEIVHAESGMFDLADTDDITYRINHNADIDEHVLDCFKLLGIIIGKSVFERTPINAYMDRSIIKHLLGQPISLEDMYFYDRQLYQSWNFLLNNEFDAADLMEYFVIYKKNRSEIYELKPNGADILVDSQNKHEYVQLCIDYYTNLAIKEFLKIFLNSFYTIIPKKFISIFEPQELEMILYGIPFINLEDWRENTEYKGAYYRTHQTIIWFWTVLAEFDQPQLAKFLQYCTGSQRTPVEGFRKLESNRGNCSKFCIESVPYSRANPFPKAHTCFNRLEFPIYESIDQVKLYLKAIVDNDLDAVFGLE